MIKLPEFKKAFEYENNFYLSCDSSRLGKLLAHYELYQRILHLPGALVECGVFKGVSFSRFAMFRALFETKRPRPIIGFDTFSEFPATNFNADKRHRERFIKDAGLSSISRAQLQRVLRYKGITDVELVSGDIVKTVPTYVSRHPRLRLAFINLDTDIYEPAVTILKYLYPRLVRGGVLVLDDYNIFPGETKAVNEYFKGQRIGIKRFPFAKTPCYIIKP